MQVGPVPLQPAQVTVGPVAGKGRRQHEGRVAEQVVLHVRLVHHPVAAAVEQLMNQALVGGRVLQLTDGDLLQIYPHNPVRLPVPRRQREGKHHLLPRELFGKLPCPDVVAHKDDVPRPIGPERLQHAVQLRIAQNHKDHVIGVLRLQPGDHRQMADGCPRTGPVLHDQSLPPDRLRPCAPGQQRDIPPGTKEIAGQIAAQHARAIHQNPHVPLLLQIIPGACPARPERAKPAGPPAAARPENAPESPA